MKSIVPRERFEVLQTVAAYEHRKRLSVWPDGIRIFWGADLSQSMPLSLAESRTRASQTEQTPLVGFHATTADGNPVLVASPDIDRAGIGAELAICVDRAMLDTVVFEALGNRGLTQADVGSKVRASIGYRLSEQILDHQSLQPRVERDISIDIAPPDVPPSADVPLGEAAGAAEAPVSGPAATAEVPFGEPVGVPKTGPSETPTPHEQPEKPAPWLSPKFCVVPVGDVVRLHDVSARGLAASQRAVEVQESAGYTVTLDPDADIIFDQEVLFGFSLRPPDSASPHAQLERVRVCIARPGAFDRSMRDLFQIAQLHRPGPRREQAILRPCPQFRTDVDDDGRIVFEVVLAVHVDYGLFVDFDEIGYEFGEVFGCPEPARSSKLSVEMVRCGQRGDARDRSHLAEIGIVMPGSGKSKVAVRNIGMEYVLVLSKGEPGRKSYHVRPNSGQCELRLTKLGRGEQDVGIRIETNAAASVFERLHHKTTKRFKLEEETRLVVEIADAASGGRNPQVSVVDLKITELLRHEFIAIDVGTAAITMARGEYGSDRTELTRLGRVVQRFAPEDVPRRERGQDDLMSSACAVTIAGAKSYVRPIHAREDFDDRYAGPEAFGDLKGATARMRAAGVGVDLHLPLWARAHERLDPNESGFLTLPSIKTQVCTRRRLRFRDAERGSVTVLHCSEPGEETSGREAHLVGTDTIFHATLDILLNPYLAQTCPQMNVPRDGVETMYVMTYPASIGARAQLRYRTELGRVVERKQSLRSEGTPIALAQRQRASVTLVSEAAAAAWALMEGSVPSLWPKSSADRTDDVVKRLILFDVGAGTVDVAAFDFAPGEHVAPIQQTVSFSLPFGGDVMDESIARDFDSTLAENADVSRGLLDRIDVGKRCMSGNLLPVPDSLDFGSTEERPARGHRITDLAGKPVSAEIFGAPIDGESVPIDWQVLDVSKAGVHLEAYLRVVEDVIVPSTLEAAAGGQLARGLRAETAVVMSGRASLFQPLRDAVQRSVDRAVQFRGETIAVQKASGFLGDIARRHRSDPDQLMKSLTVQGAVVWARRTLDEQLRLSSPSREGPLFAAVFGVLLGEWEPVEGCFHRIAAIRDLVPGANRVEPGLDNVFLIMRPALFKQVGHCESLMREPFGRRMLNRVIRPIFVVSADPEELGSPMPVGSRIDDPSRIRLAGPGEGLCINWLQSNHTDIRLEVVRDDTPDVPRLLHLSSGFLDALGG